MAFLNYGVPGCFKSFWPGSDSEYFQILKTRNALLSVPAVQFCFIFVTVTQTQGRWYVSIGM